jgi:hypothetical protein
LKVKEKPLERAAEFDINPQAKTRKAGDIV